MRKVKIIIGIAVLVINVWFVAAGIGNPDDVSMIDVGGDLNIDINQARFREATNSSPIAITRDDHFIWVVNPDNDSVSVLDVAGDLNQKVKEMRVGDEPQYVTITPDDKTVYVTNMVSGTVSVIDAKKKKLLRPYRSVLNPSAVP